MRWGEVVAVLNGLVTAAISYSFFHTNVDAFWGYSSAAIAWFLVAAISHKPQ